MHGDDLVIISVIVAAATSLVIALAVLVHYRGARPRFSRAYLFHRSGKRVVQHDLDRSVIRIGREPGNDIQLQDHSVSRFHARITHKRNGSFVINDLHSKNGIRIFRRRVTSSVLTDGDVLFVGRVGLRFVQGPADIPAESITAELESGASPTDPAAPTCTVWTGKRSGDPSGRAWITKRGARQWWSHRRQGSGQANRQVAD